MLVLLSPAKRMEENAHRLESFSLPRLMPKTKKLVRILKSFDPQMLQGLMDINPKLAELNANRFQQFGKKDAQDKMVQAVFAFQGDVYKGLQAKMLNDDAIRFGQKHVRILSGLYGLLRPLDLILPYRLEMGAALKTSEFANLYQFWGDHITRLISNDITESGSKALINLASQEYFAAVDTKRIKVPVFNISFKQYKDGKLMFITIYGKQARGLMCRFICQNNVTNPEELKGFNLENYYFEESLSGPNDFVFVR